MADLNITRRSTAGWRNEVYKEVKAQYPYANKWQFNKLYQARLAYYDHMDYVLRTGDGINKGFYY